MKLRKITFIILSFGLSLIGKAQQDTDYISTGVSIKMPDNNRLTIYGGYSPTDKILLTRISHNIKINNILSVAPAYMHRNHLENDTHSHQFIASGNLNIPITKDKKWNILSHSMYSYLIREHRSNVSFYRQRLGINHNTKISDIPINIFVYDEIFYSIDNKFISRNLISAGINFNLSWLNPSFSYAHHINKNKTYKNIITATFIIPLDKFGFVK